MAVLVISGAACGHPIVTEDPALDDNDRYVLHVTISPEVVDTAGRVLSREVVHWSGEAAAKAGRFVNLVGSVSRGDLASSTTWTVSDSAVQAALDDFGFTAAANPSFSAPIDPLTMVDTVTNAIDGIAYLNIYNYGGLGQPLTLTVYRSGVLFAKTRYVWATVPSGGVQLSSVTIEDWSQPEVLVRTTVTVTTGRVVTLTDGSGGVPRLRQISGFGQVALHGPSWARLHPVATACAAYLGTLLLPSPLHAQLSRCADAWWSFGEHVGGLVGASAALVAAPNPWTVTIYFGMVSKLIHATFNVGAACGKRS